MSRRGDTQLPARGEIGIFNRSHYEEVLAVRVHPQDWKFSAADARERRYWDDYQRAYADMLAHTSTDWAPWHVLPADPQVVCAAAVIAQALIDIDPHYPVPDEATRKELLEIRAELKAEAR